MAYHRNPKTTQELREIEAIEADKEENVPKIRAKRSNLPDSYDDLRRGKNAKKPRTFRDKA